MRKNEVLIKEEKGGKKDRLELLVPQAELGLAFSSNTASHPICIQYHFFKMLDQPWLQPSSLQLPGPCLKMDRWLPQGKNPGTLVSLTQYVETSDAGMECERR